METEKSTENIVPFEKSKILRERERNTMVYKVDRDM